jgi:hypothetical protein
MKPIIVVYTHTDVSDLWPMFFGEFKKYMPDTKIYVAVNNQIIDYRNILNYITMMLNHIRKD